MLVKPEKAILNRKKQMLSRIKDHCFLGGEKSKAGVKSNFDFKQKKEAQVSVGGSEMISIS